MTVFTDERAAHSRTPQSILTLGVKSCANWYSQTVADTTILTYALDNGVGWTKAAGTTITLNTHQPPNLEPNSIFWGTTLDFAGVGDYVNQNSGTAAVSKGFTGSWWIRTVSGTGTITIQLNDNATPEAGEFAESQVSVTETWTRFWVN